MGELNSEFNELLNHAKKLKDGMEMDFHNTEKEINNLEDSEMKTFLQNSLLSAKSGQLNLNDFLSNLQKQCQQK